MNKTEYLKKLSLRDLINLLHNTPCQTDPYFDLMNEIENRNLNQLVIKGIRSK